MAEPTLDRWLTPRVVLRVALALVLLSIALEWLAPGGDGGEKSARLTSYSYEQGGVRGLYETVERLGWKVKRSETPMRGALDTTAVYVVMQPAVDLTASEVSSLLGAVRRGAALLYVPPSGSTLADSLGIVQSDYSTFPLRMRSPLLAPPIDEDAEPGGDDEEESDESPDSGAASSAPIGEGNDGGGPLNARRLSYHYYLRAKRPLPADTLAFLHGWTTDSTPQPVILGVPLGRGRLVAVADPSLFRNYAIREANGGLLPVRLLEWLAAGRTRIIFDEYHQGYGRHASVGRTVRNALAHTTPGRMLVQLMAAGLVLLIAISVRPIAPRPRLRTERRSPFEHVGALARAYEQIGATRLAARRLIRGLRRRHALAMAGEDDVVAMRRLAARYPSLRPDVERLLEATERRLPSDRFREVADSIATMERTLAQ